MVTKAFRIVSMALALNCYMRCQDYYALDLAACSGDAQCMSTAAAKLDLCEEACLQFERELDDD